MVKIDLSHFMILMTFGICISSLTIAIFIAITSEASIYVILTGMGGLVIACAAFLLELKGKRNNWTPPDLP